MSDEATLTISIFLVIGLLAILVVIRRWRPFSRSGKVDKARQKEIDTTLEAIERGPTVGKAQLQQWVNEELSKGTPRQIISNQLLNVVIREMHPDDAQAYLETEREVSDVMVQRNLDGKEFEKAGQIDGAIALYEANVRDRFGGSHPYEKLRIIYTERKDYANAIRVCQAYMGLDALGLLNKPLAGSR